MNLSTTEPPSGPIWRRHPVLAALIGLALIMVCAVALIVIVLGTVASPVTAERQSVAQQALRNPPGAPLQLGHYTDSMRWYDPLPTYYAVQDGMVLFPENLDPASRARITVEHPEIPILVYAPGGENLSQRPGPPTDRYVASTEWFLMSCHPALLHPDWWECGLLFGSLVHQ